MGRTVFNKPAKVVVAKPEIVEEGICKQVKYDNSAEIMLTKIEPWEMLVDGKVVKAHKPVKHKLGNKANVWVYDVNGQKVNVKDATVFEIGGHAGVKFAMFMTPFTYSQVDEKQSAFLIRREIKKGELVVSHRETHQLIYPVSFKTPQEAYTGISVVIKAYGDFKKMVKFLKRIKV